MESITNITELAEFFSDRPIRKEMSVTLVGRLLEGETVEMAIERRRLNAIRINEKLLAKRASKHNALNEK